MRQKLRAPQQERSRDKLEKIYEASLELLVEGGWDAVTVGEVERRSGVGRSTFYLRFPTRDALLTYTRERVQGEVATDQAAAFAAARAAADGTLETAVRRAVEALAEVFRQYGPVLMRIDRGEEVGAGGQAMNVLSTEFRSVLLPVLGTDPASVPATEFVIQLAFSALVLEIRPRHAFPAHTRRPWDSFVDELCIALVGYLRTRLALPGPT
jgi:AcrR family transcriptional regulator